MELIASKRVKMFFQMPQVFLAQHLRRCLIVLEMVRQIALVPIENSQAGRVADTQD